MCPTGWTGYHRAVGLFWAQDVWNLRQEPFHFVGDLCRMFPDVETRFWEGLRDNVSPSEWRDALIKFGQENNCVS